MKYNYLKKQFFPEVPSCRIVSSDICYFYPFINIVSTNFAFGLYVNIKHSLLSGKPTIKSSKSY